MLKIISIPVYGFHTEPIIHLSHPLNDQESFTIEDLNLTMTCPNIPGHTLGHCMYYGHNIAFTSDTLFAAGCGRIFEGTPEQMFESLSI